MQDTSIAWADWVWNPVKGCDRISPGCQHCYAETIAARHSVASKKRPNPPFAGFAEIYRDRGNSARWTGKVELIESKLLEPLSWRRKAAKFRQEHGRKPRAFISMSDLFHENLPDEAIDRVMAVAALTPEINYMLLTKRAERMEKYFDNEFVGARIDCDTQAIIDDLVDPNERRSDDLRAVCQDWDFDEPFANVALGVSVESQKYADERIPHLLRTPAAMRFVSYEPALEAVDWKPYISGINPHWSGRADDEVRRERLDMIIVGGESGPGARPFDIAWARQTVRQCRAAGVAPFVKQMGSKPKPQCFRDRKGEDTAEWPEDLRVREWPEGWN